MGTGEPRFVYGSRKMAREKGIGMHIMQSTGLYISLAVPGRALILSTVERKGSARRLMRPKSRIS